MRFLIDTQLPKVLAGHLHEAGFEAELIAWLLPAFPQIVESLKQGDRLVEVC
jgi:hypothetical protein